MKKTNEQANLITMKIPYKTDEYGQAIIFHERDDFSKVLRFTYNRIVDNPKYSTKELTTLQASLNNVDTKSHLKNSAQYKAKEIYSQNKDDNPQKVIFGGRKNFIDRCKLLISKEEFTQKRLSCIYSVGEANKHGNRLFKILDTDTILFKPDRNNHIELHLHSVGQKRREQLHRLIELQNKNLIALTYELDENFVYITYDYSMLEQNQYKVKQGRVFAIDMNPNYLGWSITDWSSENDYRVIDSGSISLKPLNDYKNNLHVSSDDDKSIYVTNKRKHEIIEIAKQLFILCKHYKCEMFCLEALNMPAKDYGKGRRLNRLINNQWNRNLLIKQITKHVLASSTTLVEVKANYSSFIGNLAFRKEELPDEVLASIEIGRRGYEFANQYIFKRTNKKKNIIFPDFMLYKDDISQSLEELGISTEFSSFGELYKKLKNLGTKYRVSRESLREGRVFSRKYTNKYLILYSFI